MMSSLLQSSMSSNSNSNFVDEHKWVTEIRKILDEEEEDIETPVNIFSVPRILMASDPNSYEPRQVAIGPYHYCRPELYEMERYKLAAAKRTQKQLPIAKFQDLVEQILKFDQRIRACYHKYLDINDQTLAWMMAVDASFLLEFLQVYDVKKGKVLTKETSRMSHLVDFAGRKLAHNAILRDMIMLENQIPLFLLREMLKFQLLSSELAEDNLISMLIGLCKELSPFKMMVLPDKVVVNNRAHVLDFLYHLILPELKEELSETSIEVGDQIDELKEGKEGESFGKSSDVKRLFHFISNLLSKLRPLKRVLLSKPIKLLVKLPWTIISNLPGIKVIKQPINSLCFSGDKEEEKSENDDSNNNNINKPPLVREISIPSVTDLTNAGVCFLPTNVSIMKINFDVKTAKFYLPVVSLDVNTEVILRNLVAYEACSASGPLIFTRYTELMNGIIDTAEDAKLLGERKIIFNRLKNDGEVAELWNGMSKSVRSTKVPSLDKVIDDVNRYYDGKWRVKVGKFMKVYVFESWQFLTFLAAILMLLLTTLQAFCSVYRCGRIFDQVTNIDQ